MPFGIRWTMTGHRFHKNKPVSPLVMDYDVVHFPMFVDRDAQLRKVLLFPDGKLFARIPDVDNTGTGRESRTKVVDHLLNQNVLSAG